MSRRCLNCRFVGGNPDQGYACRRQPPVIALSNEQRTTSAFPPIDPSWRCGEHRLRLWGVLTTWWRWR